MEQERENYVPLISEFQQQTIATSRSPCEQVLQQQALHQQALHQQSLKQHSMDFKPKPSSFRTSPVKSEPILADFEETKCVVQEKKDPIKPVREMIIADLNVDPPESEGEELAAPVDPVNFDVHLDSTRNTNDENDQVKNSITVKDTDIMEGEGKKFMKLGKCRSRFKGEYPLESGPDTDADQQCQGVSTSREEKVSSLKAGLVHVARKMPKNAHAHFILGLMYQRLGQSQKAVSAFEKSSEILQQPEEEIGRPELLSLVQIHHAQCLLQGTAGDGSDKELETEELEDLVLKLKESVKLDVRQAAVWNTLGLMLLRSGRLQSGIMVLSSLTSVAPDFLDSLANLGIAYLQSGNLELSAKCFQDLVLKDQNHPGALINYGALLLCQYGSIIAGAGANGGERAYATQIAAANVAQECLAAAVKADPKAGHIWVNLANAYYMTGDHRSAGKCLEQATRLEPNRMSTRYAVALHRIKDAERSQDPTEQLSWAANEMASILREGDPTIVELRIAWAGLAMVHRAQHEIAAAFETRQMDLKEVEERALYTLKQAIEEDPDDAVQWHQLGLHTLCTLQFKTSQDYLKAAVARSKDCSYAWSNLGISLQLSEDPSQAEEVYKRALTLATPQQAHTIFSNLGNLYRQQKRFEDARMMFARSLELCPGYAPAYNNLGLVSVAEGQWEDAKTCFDKALLVDPLLDAAKSNLMKAVAMSRTCATKDSSLLQEKITV